MAKHMLIVFLGSGWTIRLIFTSITPIIYILNHSHAQKNALPGVITEVLFA